MINNISELNNKIIKCRSCNRLINFRKKIIKNKRKQYKSQKYWGKPITGFGDITGKYYLLVWLQQLMGVLEQEGYLREINPQNFYLI